MTKDATPDNARPEGPSDLPGRAAASLKLFRNIKGIIFDFDGTIFDNSILPFFLVSACPTDVIRIRTERLIRKQFAGSEYPSPDEYYLAFFAAFGRACFRSPEKMRNWYFNRYMPRMIRVLKKYYKPRPGAIELLKRLEARTDLRVAVYSDYPFLKERLGVLNINPDPKIKLYGPESFGAQKPAPGPFIRIAGDLGVTPEETLVIGDRQETDGLGAKRAGMRFFCLETGRKRYFRLDPYRRPQKEEPHGPSLIMYAGTWDELMKLLMERYG